MIVVFFSEISCPTNEDTEHNALSNVETNPLISIIANGTKIHVGNKCCAVIIFINWGLPSKPKPAATNPISPVKIGTIPNTTAEQINAFLISFFLVANVLCQNDWSPNGPANNPMVTTIPNEQTKFADWLYNTPDTCKEGNGAQCVANNYSPLYTSSNYYN